MTNIMGILEIIKVYKMKQNFSELARIYGKARQTIKKYYTNAIGRA